jgi:hypothetical protein
MKNLKNKAIAISLTPSDDYEYYEHSKVYASDRVYIILDEHEGPFFMHRGEKIHFSSVKTIVERQQRGFFERKYGGSCLVHDCIHCYQVPDHDELIEECALDGCCEFLCPDFIQSKQENENE